MEERISKLREQVKELMEYKRSITEQQIPFNPPIPVQNIIQQNHLVVTGKVTTTVGFFDTWLEVIIDDETFLIPATPS